MPRDPDKYDFFVSYARADNRDGCISGFVEELLAAHRRFSGGREFVPFFDKQDIRNFDDWQHRLSHGLAASRLFLAFISPNYFASEWCRREWRMWIDVEIAKHVLSAGAATLYIVEVPGLLGKLGEQDVARGVAELCGVAPPRDAFVEHTWPLVHQLRRRQLNEVQSFYGAGINALRQGDLRKVLDNLAHDLDARAEQVRRAAESETTVPPYNRQFSGRLDELLDLRNRLKDDRKGVISGVHGLGGVGKTELAFTYAHAFAGAYPGGRFLVGCEGQSSLGDASLVLGDLFRDLIDERERMTPDSYFAAIARCLRERLDERGHILLVLDNVTDPQTLSPQETDRLTALGPMLHLLATTRLPAGSSRHIAWFPLGELSEAEALELLDKHRPFHVGWTPRPSANETDGRGVHPTVLFEQDAARQIVQRLAGFALAVELVGAYLAAHETATYVGLADGLGLEDLDVMAEDQDVELRRHNHERRLQAVLGPTLAGLTEAERLAVEYAACLAPDHVPLPWLRELVVEQFPELAQPNRLGDPWQELCDRLLRLTFFTRADGEGHHPRMVRVHRLVQDLVRRELSPADLAAREQAVEALVRRRDAVLEQTTRWQEARWEIDPLDALANLWADTENPQAAWLLNDAGQYRQHLSEWPRAELLMRRGLAIDEQSYGAEHPLVAIRLNNLAELLQITNRLAEAESLVRRALAIDEKIVEQLSQLLPASEDRLQGAQSNVARGLNNLAQLLQDTNHLAEAEPLMRRALAIDEHSYGAEHPRVAIDLNNLARLLESMNRLAEAEPLMCRALDIFEHSYGAEHPNVTTNLNNLAQLLKATNRMAEAEPLLRRMVTIFLKFTRATGHPHPHLNGAVVNYGVLLEAMGRSDAEIRQELNDLRAEYGLAVG